MEMGEEALKGRGMWTKEQEDRGQTELEWAGGWKTKMGGQRKEEIGME